MTSPSQICRARAGRCRTRPGVARRGRSAICARNTPRLRRAWAYARARRWHRRQSFGIAMRYGAHRLMRRTPPPRWLALAADEPDARWTAGLARDVVYAWRSVTQRPALSGVIVMTLALALAANSTIFSLMDALVLRPYRFAGVDRLVIVATRSPTQTLHDPRVGVARRLSGLAAPIDDRAAMGRLRVVGRQPVGRREPEQVPGFRVSPGFFSIVGAGLALGRDFTADEAERRTRPPRRVGTRALDPAVRDRPRHRRHDRPARRRSVRGRRHRAGRFPDSARRASLVAAGATRPRAGTTGASTTSR